MLHYNKLSTTRGFTLIELIIVIAIVGSIMTLGLNMLQSLWQKQANGITSLEMIQIVNIAREKSLADGLIYSLKINVEKKSMELMLFDLKTEHIVSEYTAEENSDTDKKEKPKTPDVIFKSNVPAEIEDFYSTSGLKITTPYIFIHFYPDGTSDPFIIKYKDRLVPYYYFPRKGKQGTFLAEINNSNYDHPKK